MKHNGLANQLFIAQWKATMSSSHSMVLLSGCPLTVNLSTDIAIKMVSFLKDSLVQAKLYLLVQWPAMHDKLTCTELGARHMSLSLAVYSLEDSTASHRTGKVLWNYTSFPGPAALLHKVIGCCQCPLHIVSRLVTYFSIPCVWHI